MLSPSKPLVIVPVGKTCCDAHCPHACRVMCLWLHRVKDDTAKPVDGERFFVRENGSLEINDVTKEDNGQYTCFATNMEGKSAITATLDIKGTNNICI